MATNKDFQVKNGLSIGGSITKVNGVTPTNGQLLIGNTTNSNFSVTTLSTSNGISVTNGAGTINLSTNGVNSNNPNTLVMRDSSGNFSAGNITATLVGNASTATQLQSSRNVTVNGDVVQSTVAMDWSTDVVLPLTLANTGVTPGTYTTVTVNSKGLVTSASNVMGTISQILVGEVLQASGTTLIAYGNTAPTATAGTAIWTQAITPKSYNSTMLINFTGMVDVGTANRLVTITCFRGTTLIGFTTTYIYSLNNPVTMSLCLVDTPGTLSSVTYSMRIGISVAGNTWYLGKGQGATMGGSNASGWSITEIF